MFSSADKTLKSTPAIQQKAAGNSFFKKAGEETFFGNTKQPHFFGSPIQAKLTVSTPDDPQEKEADAVADKVMTMPDPLMASPKETNGEKLQKKEEEEPKARQEIGPAIQRKCASAEKVQAKITATKGDYDHAKSGVDDPVSATAGKPINKKNIALYSSDIQRQSGRGPPATSPQFEHTLQSTKGGGSALPGDTKAFMEQRFGADFSGVRIHTDDRAAGLSRSVQAHAFAHGNDIYFNSGKFSPDSTSGRSLLAHELTHTIQQGASKTTSSPAAVAKKHIRRKGDQHLQSKPPPSAHSNHLASIHPANNALNNKDESQGNSADPKHPTALVQLTPALGNTVVDAKGHITLSPSARPAVPNEAQGRELNKAEEESQPDQQPGLYQKQNVLPPTRSDNGANLLPKISRFSPIIQLKRMSSPLADPAFKGVVSKVKTTAQQAKKHEPTAKKVKDAQTAAKPPPNEKESKAKNKKVAEMDQQPAGTFDEGKFKAALRAKIAALQLNTLKEAENFKANNGAAAVKGDATAQVSSEKTKAAGSIEGKVKEAPAPGNEQGKEVGPAPATEKDVTAPPISGEQAAPKPVPAEDVSLQKESQSLDKQMTDAKVTEKQLNKSNEPSFTSAVASKKEAQQDAIKRPQEFRKDEKGIIKTAQATATGVSKSQLGAMVNTRKQKAAGVLSKQQEAKAKDEADRAKVAADIEQKFTATKTDVEAILSKLDTDVAAMFDQGISEATKSFEDYVDREVHRYKVDRYLNRIGGSLLWAADLLLGMPDEVNDIYKRGKERYVQQMDVVISRVAKLVVSQLNAAKKRINAGKQEIKAYVEKLPKNLQNIGKEAAAKVQSQFTELEQNVNNKQNELVDSLAAKYKAGLENVDKKIAEMKEANKGLVDKAIGAIKDVIDAIIEFKNMLLNVLARAAAAIELIIEDPIGFLGNLVAGVKQGIQRFLSNIGTHLKNGLMGWLFGALAEAGIQMPSTFDAKGIMSLILQVLGLTYANIRARAVNIVGEKVVSGLEKAAEIFIILKNEGIGGLWKFIKEKVEQLKDTVIEGIKSFVIEKIVVAGITWLVSMLNPASAFIKACKMIYDVIMFFVTRGSQIMALVNAVIDSVTAIAKGSIGVAATAVENALAKALPVAISFLASLLGLGGISDKIKAIIAKIQAPINAAIDWVINKAVTLVKKVAGLFSGGKDKDKKEEHSPEKQAKIDAGLLFMQQEQNKYLKEGKITNDDASKVAVAVKSNHAVFSSFKTKEVGTKIQFVYTASPEEDAGTPIEQAVELKYEVQDKGSLQNQPGNQEKIHEITEAAIRLAGLQSQIERNEGDKQELIKQIRGNNKGWALYKGAIYVPFISEHRAAVERLKAEAESSVGILGIERGGALLTEQISGERSGSSSATTRFIQYVERINPDDPRKRKVRYKSQEVENLIAEVRTMAENNSDRKITISIAETVVGGGSTLDAVNQLRRSRLLEQFPNLSIRFLLLQQTMHSQGVAAKAETDIAQAVGAENNPANAGRGEIRRMVDKAGKLQVILSRTRYILGEDVTYQASRAEDNKLKGKPVTLFYGSGEKLKLKIIVPKDETTARDIINGLVTGKMDSVLAEMKD
ncbi:DUF4157 domain-containing protein [Segetibacter sp. 3557_3]|uniref:eCIS core domain-containing protein n=1 Tax=Segetibacter sp. 3557_3 TaxID=2547429 RepID=UPI001058ADBF|nr:DUF4157 domain-containing protein [Segetibacter sp. 3557_3]TDH27276.1 DUF4157 domain-containing protein [Segetibacter sp. 3557_3]